jgi:hypothetical protein
VAGVNASGDSRHVVWREVMSFLPTNSKCNCNIAGNVLIITIQS